VASPPAKRSAIFAALAQGLEISQVLGRFQLSREELRSLFQEAANHYRAQETGYFTLYCDGAARGNPGPAGAAAVLKDPQGNLVAQASRYLGETTNNVAEYQALLLGLKLAQEHGARKIRVLADSQLLVEQLNGRYQVRSPHLLPLWQQARKELKNFEACAISHLDRRLNYQADLLARQAIDQRQQSS
jgi:ribonuclease HI